MEDLRNNVNLDRHEGCGDYDHGYDHHHDNHCCTPSTDTELKPVRPCNEGKCCDPLTYDVHDISTFECVPILADRVFDCTKLESTAMGMQIGLTFTVTTNPCDCYYSSGEPVCIEKIGLNYDCLGMLSNELTDSEYVNSNKVPFSSHYSSCSCNTNISFYNEFYGSLQDEVSCTDHKHKDGAKVRLYSKNPPYAVCNLQIVVSGKIGCKPFRAYYDFDELLDLGEELGLDTQSSGKLCVPEGINASLIKVFDGKLYAPCANATSTAIVTGISPSQTTTFVASVEFCFEAVQHVYAIVREKLAVVASDCAPCQQHHHHDSCNSHNCK